MGPRASVSLSSMKVTLEGIVAKTFIDAVDDSYSIKVANSHSYSTQVANSLGPRRQTAQSSRRQYQQVKLPRGIQTICFVAMVIELKEPREEQKMLPLKTTLKS